MHDTEMQPGDADLIRMSYARIQSELSKIIIGQTALIENLFICLLCGGHALVEGVPGLGKTLVVKSLSRVLDLDYSRIQFTPDLMPADILGTNIVNEDERGRRFFEFFKGPIFGQMILADEINRATPKTQSALLEAMQERRVTIFGHTHELRPPFIVFATQNPLEMEGTYPLPEAQVDRFFFKIKVEYPDREQLNRIVDTTSETRQPQVEKVFDGEAILNLADLACQVPMADQVKDYAVRLVLATHPNDASPIKKVRTYVRHGSSPRGAQAIVRAARVAALLQGRYHVGIEDIRQVALPALRHRLILNLKAEAEGLSADNVIEDVLAGVPRKTRDG
jgi:MoxR-like ATPase